MARKKAARKAAKKAAQKRPAARRAAPRAKAAKPARNKAAASRRKKDGRPASPWWPALSPYLLVRDGQAAIEFYARAFGFETCGQVTRGDDGSVRHAGLRLGEAAIMISPEGMAPGMQSPAQGGGEGALSLYVYVPDVDVLHARAARAGAKVLQPPADQFWGDRCTMIKDPDGYHWTFATNVRATPHS